MRAQSADYVGRVSKVETLGAQRADLRGPGMAAAVVMWTTREDGRARRAGPRVGSGLLEAKRSGQAQVAATHTAVMVRPRAVVVGGGVGARRMTKSEYRGKGNAGWRATAMLIKGCAYCPPLRSEARMAARPRWG